MEKIKNKIFIRSILVTLSLVLCFSFGFNEKNGFRIPLPSPKGKVPTSSAAGGVMSSEQARGHTPHFRSVPSAR